MAEPSLCFVIGEDALRLESREPVEAVDFCRAKYCNFKGFHAHEAV